MSDQSINVLQKVCTREISRRNKGLLGKSKEDVLAQPWGCHTPGLIIVALQVDVRAFLFLERWTRFSASEEPRDLLHLRTLHHAWSVCAMSLRRTTSHFCGEQNRSTRNSSCLSFCPSRLTCSQALTPPYPAQSFTLQLSRESTTTTFAAPVPSPPSSRLRRSADHRKQRCRPAIYLIPKLGRIGAHLVIVEQPLFPVIHHLQEHELYFSQFISAIKTLPNWLRN